MSRENNKTYLEKNVRGIIQPMVGAVLLDKPKDPVSRIKYNLLKNLNFKTN